MVKPPDVNPKQALRAMRWLRPYRWAIGFGFLALTTSALIELSLGLIVRKVIDGEFVPGFSGNTRSYLLAAGGVGIAYAVASYFRIFLVLWTSERAVADVRNDIFGHVLGLSPGFFETTKIADVISRLVVDTSLTQTLLSAAAPSGLHSVILLAGSAVLMAANSTRLATIAFSLLPVCALPSLAMGKQLRRLSREAQSKLGRVGAEANESLRAVSTVQAFGHEAIDRRRVAAGVQDALDAARHRFSREALLSCLVALFTTLSLGVVLIVGLRDVASGAITAGQLTAFVIYLVMGAGSFAALCTIWAQAQRAAGAVDRILEILSVEPDLTAPTSPLPLPDPPLGTIEFKDVTFRYPSRPATAALDSISLQVKRGETVALVGPSGAGKSTIFNLILRFYDIESGQILLDGVDIAQVEPSEVRSRISVVSQEPDLFSATVTQNILYGAPQASMEQVVAASKAAAAAEFIEALPEGYDTHLGEEGVMLSGGQRQRLAIARALVRESAGVLLFDEATSALDSDSERKIQQALARAAQQRTVMVIAHRLATVKMADRIVVMDGGRIVDIGTHDELMDRCPLYAGLANQQFGNNSTTMPAPPEVEVIRWVHRLPGWEHDGGSGIETLTSHEAEWWDR